MCFDYGYGPFRWVCLSGKAEDLRATDAAAMACIDPNRRGQDRDNWQWIHDAETNALVVGTQARILYADAEGRTEIARRFNQMVAEGEIGPVMMGRDHHDTGGTDSPYRETANIYDGSSTVADMSHQCWAGNAARGMTMAVLSNGGGVGTGKAINGGFGLVLDGSERVDRRSSTSPSSGTPWAASPDGRGRGTPTPSTPLTSGTRSTPTAATSPSQGSRTTPSSRASSTEPGLFFFFRHWNHHFRSGDQDSPMIPMSKKEER